MMYVHGTGALLITIITQRFDSFRLYYDLMFLESVDHSFAGYNGC